MKALNLKSMSWFMALLSMMFVISFTACSDDDENSESAVPVFPELKEITCDADQSTTISFTANMEWVLSSNESWLKFVNGDFTETNISGKAGEQTITINVSADNQNFTEDVIAEITLSMGEQSQVIYKVKRAKKEYQDLVITDEEGNVYDAEHPLTIKGNDISTPVYTSLKAQVEDGTEIGFDNPGWLSFRIDKETGMYEFTFNTDNAEGLNMKYPIVQGDGGVLVFTTADAATAQTDKIRKVEIPLIYEGVKADAVGISPTFMNATVSYDGQSIVSGETTSDKLVSTIIARNDEFSIVEFTQTYNSVDGTYTYDFSGNGDVDWVTCVQGTDADKDKITLTVAPNTGDERSATIMVFPKAVYDEIKDDLTGNIVEKSTGEIKTQYNTNIMAILKQEKHQQAAERITFSCDLWTMIGTVGGSNMLQPIEGEVKVSFEDLGQSVDVSEYGIKDNNVWTATVPATMASSQGAYNEGEAGYLVFVAQGKASEDTMSGAEYSGNIHGKEISGQTFDQETWGMISVTGWGISFDPESECLDYQIIVTDANDEKVALCIVKVDESK